MGSGEQWEEKMSIQNPFLDLIGFLNRKKEKLKLNSG